MKKALISRYGAYGDIIHCSFLPHMLKMRGYDVVDFETNWKGLQLLTNNPFIDNLIFFEPTNDMQLFSNPTYRSRHWYSISQEYDLFINLYCSLEHGCIAMESDPEYYMHPDARKWMREISFYDQTAEWAGFKEECGKWTGELYFTDKEHEIIEKWYKKFDNKYVIFLNLSGTTIHKRFVLVNEVAKWCQDNIPNVHIITTGDKSCESIDLKGENVTSIVGKFPFRQAALLTKYVDLMISMESGLAVASHVWNTPTIQLLTSSSIVNHCEVAENNYSLESPAKCSPCSKGPYKFIGCPHKDGFPICVYFSQEDIIDQIKKAYDDYKNERVFGRDKVSRPNDAKLPIM